MKAFGVLAMLLCFVAVPVLAKEVAKKSLEAPNLRDKIMANVNHLIDYSNKKDAQNVQIHINAIERDLKKLDIKNEGELAAKTAIEKIVGSLKDTAKILNTKKSAEAAAIRAFAKIHEGSQKLFPFAKDLKTGKLATADVERIEADLRAFRDAQLKTGNAQSAKQNDSQRKNTSSQESSKKAHKKNKSKKIN